VSVVNEELRAFNYPVGVGLNLDPTAPIQIGYMRIASLGDGTAGTNTSRYQLARPTSTRRSGLWYGLARWYAHAPIALVNEFIVGNPLNWFVAPDSNQLPTWQASGAVVSDGTTSATLDRDRNKHFIGTPDGTGVASIDIITSNEVLTVVSQIWFCVWSREVWRFGGPRWPDMFQ